ncbi:hypothetical protein ACQ86K_12970 [Mucilaginibacter sp. P19]|uniref:Uncharacterized protein n=1 Tax=Mucilaginibacter gossypii TaxID=551996 RepID=A0A1G8D7J1_9SPHI|nr:hypothetical protein [Mucilaginibacter gossypii]SDH53671.1 hypothetical protein SAMN05192573_110146 [Mucilaginibacter gossypii]
METNLAVLSTDSVDRYGYRIWITALEMALKDRFKEGMPMLFAHNQHKPMGWAKPFALYLEPHLTRLLALQHIPVTDEEKALVLENHAIFRTNKYFESSKEFLEPFSKLLELNNITGCKVTHINCLTANKSGIAKLLYPFLFEKTYRDNLVPFKVLFDHFEYLGQGIFKNKYSELVVFAHHFFRRSESIHNTLNAAFLDELISLRNNTELDLYLRIDEDQLGYAPSFRPYMELEYQWGPTYNDDITSIKEGVSVHICDPNERAYYEFSRSEFLWEWDKPGQKFSFQMEELQDDSSPLDNDHYHCRYIHTVYDKTKGGFEHFDAAIRSYDVYEMLDRLDKDIKGYGKQSVYTKLFKINGPLALSKWKLLVTLFLRGNPIIYEYFGLKKEYEALKPAEEEPLTLEQHLFPYKIEAADGLRLMVSLFNPRNTDRQGRYVDSFDIISDDVKSYRCIDYYFLEFKKSLMKIGDNINIPEEVLLIKSPDNYWNIPLIMHAGPEAQQLLNNSVQALINLFEAMIRKNIDFNISLTIGITLSDRIIQISSYGQINMLLDWLKLNMPFPENEHAFTEWLVTQKRYLEHFPAQGKLPIISELIQFDGVLYPKRTVVKSSYQFDIDPEKGLKWAIDIEGLERKIYEAGVATMVPAIEVMESICHDTKEDYFTSSRSRWLDDDLRVVDITHWRPVFLHWAENQSKSPSSQEIIPATTH